MVAPALCVAMTYVSGILAMPKEARICVQTLCGTACCVAVIFTGKRMCQRAIRFSVLDIYIRADAVFTQVFNIACFTHHGSVAAAEEWGAPIRRRYVRPSIPGSYEARPNCLMPHTNEAQGLSKSHEDSL